jgi:hypothetical protein
MSDPTDDASELRLMADDPLDIERRLAAATRAIEALGFTLDPAERALIERVDACERRRRPLMIARRRR